MEKRKKLLSIIDMFANWLSFKKLIGVFLRASAVCSSCDMVTWTAIWCHSGTAGFVVE
jgi:hypothetical protein